MKLKKINEFNFFNKSKPRQTSTSFVHSRTKFPIIKLIDEHKNAPEYIKNINNKVLISFGTKNDIFVFNDSLRKIDKINLNNWTYNLECRTLDSDDDNLKIFACTKNEIYIIYFSNDNLINSHLSLKRGTFNIPNKMKFFKSFEGYYREGIKLNDNLIAFTSNKIVSRGENKLVIYDYLKEKIVLKKYGYSFILSSNGLSVIENQNDKILLCACKKYNKKQKNGIFLMNLNYIFNNNYGGIDYTKFIDTKDFEVHCFHQISILKENYFIFRMDSTEKTNFFFAGGFEQKKNKGNIRLYKVINYRDLKVEEIHNIIFYKFMGPICCITQLLSNNFIISCWDGNIFSLKFSNIDSYLFDQKIGNEKFNNLFL